MNWPAFNKSLITSDLIAGLTVGLMVVPQSVAYAALAGMPLVTGIYASLLPALIAVMFSSSVRVLVGPTAITCLLISASLQNIAQSGTPEWINLAVWLALLSGCLQILLGLIRAGWIFNVVNMPVLIAFTQAAAILIIASQLPTLLGSANGIINISTSSSINFSSLLFGLISLVFLLLARGFKPNFPAILVVVLASSAVSYGLGFEASGGHVVGNLPSGLPSLDWPTFPGWPSLSQLLIPVIVITLISFLETAASAKIDNDNQGSIWNLNQDLIGQGLAKCISGLCGSFPTSSSFSRSALNLYAGAKSGWAAVFSVLIVWLSLIFLLPLLHNVPHSVLASIVIVAVIGLLKPRELMRIWHISPIEACIAAATFIMTLATAPELYWGVFIGVLLSLSHYLYQRLHPRIIEVGKHSDGRLRDRNLWNLPVIAPETYALRMDAALDFGSAQKFEENITSFLIKNPTTKQVILLAQSINRIDVTGVETFFRLSKRLASQERTLVVVGLKLNIDKALKDTGELQPSPYLRIFTTEDELYEYIKLSTFD